ncbi:oligoendopeptidase F [Marivirga tractuosa]|uniref:Oligoendopeptidase, M3 family n=1 Tax=Marivirga tractuosa (strain ATCC 23168 / DSM 4126 / NBRC 15989 / NCIMB 1408 / VKM B-1430 / H-43) TaxID=643867 RepID=E4TQ37_MARTH|nr:M3 family oligoendopeptidase [Marivirga tractuosa]ADR21583.1 oligoendopeptidase, M3 family [Marivirga tractuosa DSM 4126]BDD13961.1 oligoendopeptidase F [Marivirga tractuosa]
MEFEIKERQFLPKDFKVKDWETLKPYFDKLLEEEINSALDLENWFANLSELEAVVSEDMAWRYIKMTCDTSDEKLAASFEDFVRNIQPHIAPYSDKLNRKALASPYLASVKEKDGYDIMIREMEKDVKIFREENIPLETEIASLSQKYGSISGAMDIEHDGKEMTLQQAAVMLQSIDRKLREEIYRKISSRRLADKDKLDNLFTELIQLRTKVAKNAGFENYRDFMFASMGRFDYSPQDCFDFHESVKTEVVPFLNEIAKDRKSKLGLDKLRPWDKAVDISGKEALMPFNGADDLTDKTIKVFNELDPFLGDCLVKMVEMKHLDLDSRKGKSPGGYNYPLSETGVPFIFMNATSTLRDMVTLLHEGGHAVHSFLMNELELNDFKNPPSEVAELASMSMELITLDYWDIFFDNEEDLKRAKTEHLEGIIETLPWVATIDKFQHWIYENPEHTVAERTRAWNEILDDFSDSITDWSGLEKFKDNLWQKQLHLYEVPFYYIEYGMAQLGAVAVWKNYKTDPKKGLESYMKALKMGYTKSIPEVYEAADIKFDFSKKNISELMSFVKEEMEKL